MKQLAIILCVACLTACSTSAPLPSYYLLRSELNEGTRILEAKAPFALGGLTIAPYIDQPGMLLETSEGDLRPARFHLWAEPLRDGARSLLMSAVSGASGYDILPWQLNSDATRFDIRIDQLHGTSDGKAKLVAHWWLYEGDKVGDIFEYAGTEPLTQDGYGALAAAQQQLLLELAGAIAKTLVNKD